MDSTADKALTVLAILLVVAAPMVIIGSAVYAAVLAITALAGVSDTTAVIIVAVFAVIVYWLINDPPVTIGDAPRSGNPPPERSPIKKMNLLMPLRVGQQGVRGLWPPFWGHKFPLGGAG